MFYNSSNKNDTTLQWRHITHNFILTSLDRDRDTDGLYPAVDNDDGSRFYFISSNVVASGGFKNFLGSDKRWEKNLIVFPDRMWGDPCAQLWGGENNRFEMNTCLLGRPPNSELQLLSEPIGLDGTTGLFPCKVDFENKTLTRTTAFLRANRYYTVDGTWLVTCGNRTTNATKGEMHNWTLADMQAGGWELGSHVHPLADIDAAAVAKLGRALLLV
jgi:hypothetical protein